MSNEGGEVSEPRRFPVVSGGTIPWEIAEAAYIEYARKYGKSQTLERMAERGGFHVDELDMFRPSWRAEIVLLDSAREEITDLRKRLEESERQNIDDALMLDAAGSDIYNLRLDLAKERAAREKAEAEELESTKQELVWRDRAEKAERECLDLECSGARVVWRKVVEAQAGLARAEERYDVASAAVIEHYSQRADDRCFEDDDKLYAVFGLPPVDRRVGDRAAMLENCRRFIERRCEGGGWPSYRELEERIAALEGALRYAAADMKRDFHPDVIRVAVLAEIAAVLSPEAKSTNPP